MTVKTTTVVNLSIIAAIWQTRRVHSDLDSMWQCIMISIYTPRAARNKVLAAVRQEFGMSRKSGQCTKHQRDAAELDSWIERSRQLIMHGKPPLDSETLLAILNFKNSNAQVTLLISEESGKPY